MILFQCPNHQAKSCLIYFLYWSGRSLPIMVCLWLYIFSLDDIIIIWNIFSIAEHRLQCSSLPWERENQPTKNICKLFYRVTVQNIFYLRSNIWPSGRITLVCSNRICSEECDSLHFVFQTILLKIVELCESIFQQQTFLFCVDN